MALTAWMSEEMKKLWLLLSESKTNGDSRMNDDLTIREYPA